MIRVAFLSQTMHIGGAENWILTLAQHFTNCDPVGLFVTMPHYHPAQMRRAKRIMPVEITRDGDSTADIRRKVGVLCKKADVLITWGEPRLPFLVRDDAGRQLIDIPVIDVSHGDADWCEVKPDGQITYPQRDLMARSYSGATHWAAVSEGAAKAFPEEVQGHVKVIPNGVDVNRCVPRRSREQVIAQYGLAGFEKIVLFLGRFAPVKQPMKLVEAAKHLPPEWGVLFFGHGPLEADLREATESMENVKVFKPIDHPGDILQVADVMAMPSIAEGHPLTANEAWLAGVPVVAFDFSFSKNNPGMFDIVESESSAKHFAEALENSVAMNTDFNGDMALRLPERERLARRHFTAPAFTQRWEEYLYVVTGSKLKLNIFGSVE